MNDVTSQQVLDLELKSNDAYARTVRGYLVSLLVTLWREGEGFSGKRPFGNSSWEYDLYEPLIRAGLVEGSFDKDGYLDEFPQVSRVRADEIISSAIKSLNERIET